MFQDSVELTATIGRTAELAKTGLETQRENVSFMLEHRRLSVGFG